MWHSHVMPSLPHIEDINPTTFSSVLERCDSLSLIEKLDGMSLSLEQPEPFKVLLKTKHRTYNSPDEISNAFFFDDLRKSAPTLFETSFELGLPWKAVGEYIPQPDFNIIAYPKVTCPAFVVFSISVDPNGRPIDHEHVIRFCEKMNRKQLCEWSKKVRFIPIELFQLNLTTSEIKEIFSTSTNITEAKKQIFLLQTEGFLGNKETEGFVLYVDNKPYCKLVDKQQFTEKKKYNWRVIEEMKQHQTQMIRKIRKNPENLEKHLNELMDYLSKREIKPGMFSVSRKYIDTCLHHGMMSDRVSAILLLLRESTPKQVAELILERKI